MGPIFFDPLETFRELKI